MSTANHREDLINGMVARQCAVEDVELAFQTLWDVITTSTRLDHGGQELHTKVKRHVNRHGSSHIHFGHIAKVGLIFVKVTCILLIIRSPRDYIRVTCIAHMTGSKHEPSEIVVF